MAITPTSSDSSAELSGEVDSPAVSGGGDLDSVSGEEVEVEEEDDEEDPEELLEEEEEEEEEVSEDGDEGDPEEVLEEEEEEEVKEDGVEDAPEEVADEEEEEEGEGDGEGEEEGEEDDEEPVEEEEVVEEEEEGIEDVEEEEVEMEIAEEEEEVSEEDGEEPREEDEEEAEVADEEDGIEEEEEEEEEEGEEEIDADGEEVVEEEAEEAEEVKGGQEDVQEVLEEDNVDVEDDIGTKVDEDVVREVVKEGEVIKEEEKMKDVEGDGEEVGMVEEEVKQEDEATKGGEDDVKVEDVGEKVEVEGCGEGRKEGTGLPIVNTRDISAKIEPEELGGPNSFSCTPERCNPSTTVVHVKDGHGGNLHASNPSGSGAQMEVDMPTESLKDVEQGHDSQIGLVSRDSVTRQYTRLDQENNISVEKKNEHGDVLEIEAPHLHTKTGLQAREGLSLSSMHTLEKRPRSSSPDAVIKHANKKPAIICDFFARGWCIKGKSCSFLHQKEGVINTSLQTKDVAGINRNGGFLHGTGLREDVERSKHAASQEVLNFSNTESSSKSPLTAQKDLVRAYGEAYELPKLHYDYNMHGAHPQSRRASYAPIDDFRQPFSQEEYKRPFGPSPHIDAMDERRLAGDNLLSGGYPTSHFPSQDSRTSYGLTSSLRASTHGFTRMGAEHLDARMPSNFVRGNYGYRSASLTKNISSYCSTSEAPHTAQKDVPLAGKTAEVRDAWVPSIPFRSSVCRDPTNIPSYRSQYDPVLDCIAPSNIAKSTFETIQNVSNQHMNGGTTPSGIHTPGYGAQQSLNSFSQLEAVFGKSKVDHGLNGSAGTSATPEPSTVDGGSNFMSKKDEHWIPGHAVDGVNVNDAEASLGGDLKNIEDKGRNNKDSRTMKFFHCALVDFVKELVKPSWREGHLSKDAHKMVVKKAVEKVLSAIQPHQVPGNAELVNHYLSASRSKILKLVEGYVEKYSKSGAS